MSYIRGALPNLIFNPNTRDDIVPDGVTSTFTLSQEVPGGYEQNVQVIRRQQKIEMLIESFVGFTFASPANTILFADTSVAAALSVLNVGDIINISGAANAGNNGDLLIQAVSYDGSQLIVTVEEPLTAELAGASVTALRKFAGPWEILEPEVDYTISGTGGQFNRLINFSDVPQEQDVIYVLHRGEATFNLVPTEKSVGPEQLQDNLRNFRVDIFAGNGSQTVFTLSQVVVSPRAIEVSVNGVVKYGSDTDLSFVGDFDLSDIDGVTVTFAVAPANLSKIYVRHLGFSTISRRQALSPSQVGGVAPASIGTTELANNAVTNAKLADNAVVTSKIADKAVTGAKILLGTNEYLNAASGLIPLSSTGILKSDASDNTTVRAAGGIVSINLSDSSLIQIQATVILDTVGNGVIDLGSSSHKFKDIHLSGNADSATLSTSGNGTIGGNLHVVGNQTLDGNLTITGTIDSVDITSLQAQVNALSATVAANSPAGTIQMWAQDAAAPAGYLLCDGSSVSTATYAALFTKIGYAFGGSGGSFSLPDLRGRFPLGKAPSGTASGWGISGQGGSLDHTHTTPSHTHGMANHVHNVGGHFHGMGAGATLNISTSGSHLTAIDHNHGAIVSSGGTAHSHGFSLTTLGGGSDGIHSHTGSFGSNVVGLDHQHGGVTNVDGTHTHGIKERHAGDQASGAGTERAFDSIRRTGNVQGVDWNDRSDLSTTTNSAHGHGFSSAATIPSVGVNVDLSHAHTTTVTFSGNGGHSHSITGTINAESAHTHTVSVPNFSANSSSSGNHTHAAGSFGGVIGLVTGGADGNAGFSSGTPSPNLTDAGGIGATTGANPAFQTLHFIIKT